MKKQWAEATEAGNVCRSEELLKAGADINALDKYSQTALMNAAVRGDANMVGLLVRYGANLNHTAKYRLTALMLAVINRHVAVVQILKEAGADVELGGSQGSFERTPLQYANEHGFEEIARILIGVSATK